MKRREFIQSSGGTLAVAGVPTLLRGKNLNSAIQLAAIGTEARGWADLEAMASHANPTDCLLRRRPQPNLEGEEAQPEAPVYQYREMLDKEGTRSMRSRSAYLITCMPSRPRLAAQKHVFCQKPLTHTVWEARQVRLQAEKSGVITRMGNQIHSHGFYRTAVGLVQSGAIGKVRRVHSWINATGHGKSGQIGRVSFPATKRIGVEFWLGVAPSRPYGRERSTILGVAGLARFWAGLSATSVATLLIRFSRPSRSSKLRPESSARCTRA